MRSTRNCSTWENCPRHLLPCRCQECRDHPPERQALSPTWKRQALTRPASASTRAGSHGDTDDHVVARMCPDRDAESPSEVDKREIQPRDRPKQERVAVKLLAMRPDMMRRREKKR